MRWRRLMVFSGLVASGGLAGCSDDESAEPAPTVAAVTAERCLVRLHGKSDTGAPAIVHEGYAELAPTGNDDAGGGNQWLYFPDDEYAAARDIVAEAISAAECERVVLNGFSNGAAFTASMYCNGETFGGRLTGVVIDDPVPDESALDCRPGAGVEAALYWTGALTEAVPGTDCGDIGWTCEGGTVVGVDAYADSLGIAIQPSPYTTHTWHRDAPELAAWLTS